jgi:hypothetical protein
VGLTEQERFEVWADLMRRRVFPPGLLKSEIRAALNAADDWVDANAASYNTALPQPYRGAADPDQKAILLALICLKRAGVLPGGLLEWLP